MGPKTSAPLTSPRSPHTALQPPKTHTVLPAALQRDLKASMTFRSPYQESREKSTGIHRYRSKQWQKSAYSIPILAEPDTHNKPKEVPLACRVNLSASSPVWASLGPQGPEHLC